MADALAQPANPQKPIFFLFHRVLFPSAMLRVRTHDQNFAPLIICNKIVTFLKINAPACQITVPPCQINYPPSQINVPHCQINVPRCQINVPWSNKFPRF